MLLKTSIAKTPKQALSPAPQGLQEVNSKIENTPPGQQTVKMIDRVIFNEQLPPSEKRHQSTDATKRRILPSSVPPEKAVPWERSKDYSHQQMQNCLRPLNFEQLITPKDHYQTEATRQTQKQQVQNEYASETKPSVQPKAESSSGTGVVMNIEGLHSKYVSDHNKKVELQQTRRILEVYNQETLRQTMGESSPPFLREKVAKYVSAPQRNKNASQTHDTTQGYFVSQKQTDTDFWVPDRFNKHGWKYVQPGTFNQHLNHPNKVNSHGFLYSLQQEKLKNNLSPRTTAYLYVCSNALTNHYKLEEAFFTYCNRRWYYR